VWWPAWGGLRWVDMLRGEILHLQDSGAVSRWQVGRVAAAFRPRRSGGVIIATERDFVIADEPGGPVETLASPFTDPALRFNDGGCDPAGRFLCGTMAYDEAPGAGTLYRITADGSVDVVLTGATISNGLAWTGDGSRAYYNDTPTGQIDVFDSGLSGELTGRRRFVSVEGGSPDGLTVDADGGVWVALWGGGAVHHYDSDGRLADVVEVAAANVTACTFGGAGLDELFITTSAKGDADHPAAGAVFRHTPGVRGLPAAAFAG
jgi:sugar lactone lactonase YvrE